jgi:hypothetical protein
MDKAKKELLKKYIALLYTKVVDGEGLQTKPKITLTEDEDNAAQDPLGKTAYFNANDNSIRLYITGRLIVDCLRSFVHECIHLKQKERGDLDNRLGDGVGYAQNDPHMRKMEEEAYVKGSLYLRDLQDELRQKK